MDATSQPIDGPRPYLPPLLRLFCLALFCLATWIIATAPGTHRPLPLLAQPTRLPEILVRVNLTPEAGDPVRLEVDGPYEIREIGAARALSKGTKLAAVDVLAPTRGLQIGERRWSQTALEIQPQSGSLAWVNGHAYHGTIRLHRRGRGDVLAVNHVPLEAYVASVIDSEMPASFGDEARKAQAIIARTYAALQIRETPAAGLFDLYATTRSQKYLGVKYRAADGRLLAGESAGSRKLAADTAGMVCTVKGVLFRTYYSACCGGRTVTGTEVFSDAAAPHQSVACRWCQEAPKYRWQVTVPRSKVEASVRGWLEEEQHPLPAVRTIRPASRNGWSPAFLVSDGRRTESVPALEMRSMVGAHSHRFHLTPEGPNWLVQGAGHGHGVGLCQWGARGQAAAGRTAAEILQSYYPGSQITRLKRP